MATVDYPSALPGVHVNSNAYSPKNIVARNNLASGPPLFVLEDTSPWVMFDVTWKFNGLQTQVFRNWYRVITSGGARAFNIGLWVDGFNGSNNIRTHECYFDGAPRFVQNGARFYVSARLLALEEVGVFDADDADALVNAYNTFGDDLTSDILSLDAVITLLEDEWLP